MKTSPLNRSIQLLCLGIATFVSTLKCQAYSGDNDNTFSQQGAINGPIYSVVVDSHTNIWIAGDFTSVYGNTANYVAILNPNGTFKQAADWGVTSYFQIHALALGNGDRVYAAGKNGVVRFGSSGSIDGSFLNPYAYGATKVQYLSTIAVRPTDDAIWVAGQYGVSGIVSGGTNTFSLPGTFASQYVSQIRYIAPAASQNATAGEYLLVSGAFGTISVLANGSLNVNYSVNNFRQNTCAAARSQADVINCGSSHGDILAGGNFDPEAAYTYFYPSTGPTYLARYGGTDSATYFPVIDANYGYPANQGGSLAFIEAMAGGDMLIGGDFTRINGANVNHFAHLLPDGKVDTSFNNIVGYEPSCIAQQPDGKYIVAGYSSFTPLTGQISRRLAMDAPRGVSFTLQPGPTNLTFYPGDYLSLSAGVDAWPPPSLVWLKNGNETATQNTPYYNVYSVTNSDSGNYQLRAKTFCSGNTDSATAHVTVLPAPAAPANDNFANAIALTGTNTSATGTIRSATIESGEPDATSQANGRSVWWTWTAPKDGFVTLNLGGTDFSASLNVFTGTAVGSLTAVTNNCDLQCYSNGEGGSYCNCNGLLNNLYFAVTQGMTYRIAVGGTPPSGGLGNIHLSLTFGGAITPVWQKTTSGTGDLEGAAYNGTNYVVVGYPSYIATSTDGTNWNHVNSQIPSFNYFYEVTYAKGLFVAVADNGYVVTSPDGTNWTQQSSGVSSGTSLYSIAFGTNGLFVAVGDSGTIITSRDGTNWAAQVSGDPSDSLYAVTYGKGLFVAMDTATSVPLTSPNGSNWTLQASITPNSLSKVAYGNGRFVTVGSPSIYYSTNATNWTVATTSPATYMESVVFAGGYFLGVGDSGEIMVSADGDTWYVDNSGTSADLYGACLGAQGRSLVVGTQGTILLHSAFEIRPFSIVPGTAVHLQINGLNGAQTVIESTPSLKPPTTWTPLATNRFTNSITTYDEVGSTVTNRFYRARLK